MATIKYQQRIHEAFAKEIAGNPAEEMKKAVEQFPQPQRQGFRD